MTDEELIREAEELDNEVTDELCKRYVPYNNELNEVYYTGMQDGIDRVITCPHMYDIEFDDSFIEEESYRRGYKVRGEEEYLISYTNYLDREFDL